MWKQAYAKFEEWKHPMYDHLAISAAIKNHPAVIFSWKYCMCTCFSLAEFLRITIKDNINKD